MAEKWRVPEIHEFTVLKLFSFSKNSERAHCFRLHALSKAKGVPSYNIKTSGGSRGTTPFISKLWVRWK